MPKQRLYYEYIDGQLVPYWFVLTLNPCEVDWDKPVFHFDLIKPLEFVERNEFDDSQISMSIYLSDLIFNNLSTERIGINLTAVKRRIEKHGMDPELFTQFVLSAPEVEDFLLVLPTEYKRTMTVFQ